MNSGYNAAVPGNVVDQRGRAKDGENPEAGLFQLAQLPHVKPISAAAMVGPSAPASIMARTPAASAP
jgi:hypothetical protein